MRGIIKVNYYCRAAKYILTEKDMNTKDIIVKINGGELDATFAELYGNEKISAARARYTNAVNEFEKIYGKGRDA